MMGHTIDFELVLRPDGEHFEQTLLHHKQFVDLATFTLCQT